MPIPTSPAHRVVQNAIAHSIDDFNAMALDSFMPMKITSEASGFRGAIRTAVRDDVHCYEITADAHIVSRGYEHIGRTTTGDFYKVSLVLHGTTIVAQDGREATLHAGDIAVYDTTRPYTLVSDAQTRSAVVMLPRHLIDLPHGVMDEITAVRVDGRSGLGAIISPLIASLATDLDQLATPVGARIAHHVVDTLTTLLAAEADVADDDPAHRSLLRRIYAHIDEHLTDPSLSPASVAAAHFISTRHLQDLFHREGTTVSRLVRERRLARCRRDLADPLLAGLPIAAIAARWGFLDPAHFSRVFRSRFGRTPREMRILARELC